MSCDSHEWCAPFGMRIIEKNYPVQDLVAMCLHVCTLHSAHTRTQHSVGSSACLELDTNIKIMYMYTSLGFVYLRVSLLSTEKEQKHVCHKFCTLSSNNRYITPLFLLPRCRIMTRIAMTQAPQMDTWLFIRWLTPALWRRRGFYWKTYVISKKLKGSYCVETRLIWKGAGL